MKKNRIPSLWMAIVVAVIVVGVVRFQINREPAVSSTAPFSEPIQNVVAENPDADVEYGSPNSLATSSVLLQNIQHSDQIAPVTLVRVEEPALITEPSNFVKLQGYGESAVLLDAVGNPLLKATKSSPIYSVKASPSGQQVVISRGNGVHQIYRLTPFVPVRELPITPDIPQASAFEAWQWLDETTLIGVSATKRPAEDLQELTAAEQEAQWRESTLLYRLQLSDGALERIVTDVTELPESYTVIDIRPGGFLKVEWDEQETARTAWIGPAK